MTLPARGPLLDRLFEETGTVSGAQRLTVFDSPTGYGKTRTIVQWLGDDPETSENDRVQWIHCTPGVKDNFWPTVSATLSKLSSTPHHPGEDQAAEATRLAGLITEPSVLILDDYHHVTTPEIDVSLAMLSTATPLLRLVIAGRRTGLLTSPLISARTRVRTITEHDLALTTDESYELAASLGVPHDQALEAALEQADGWPLAIRAALNIGSDATYLGGGIDRVGLDPLANLSQFALGYVELLSPAAKHLMLVAALLDAIDEDQLIDTLLAGQSAGHSAGHAAGHAAINELVGLGLLTATTGQDGPEYRVHRSVKATLDAHARRFIPAAERNQIYIARANKVKHTSPCVAFMLLTSARTFEQAELLLAQNFTTITDEGERCATVLRALPEEALNAHPTFTAALIYLETPRLNVAGSTLAHLTDLWLRSLKQRLPDQVPATTDPMYIALLCQAMIATRIIGKLEASEQFMRSLEARLTSNYDTTGPKALAQTVIASPLFSFSGAIPSYYREMAATALAVGDLTRARRFLAQLREHAEAQVEKRWSNAPSTAPDGASKAQIGHRWALAAISELAFTELVDGNFARLLELLTEYDARINQSGEQAPGIAWTGAEFARAHLSYEQQQPELLEVAALRLRPLIDRLEAWPLLLMAEAGLIRSQRGSETALTHVRASLEQLAREGQEQSVWSQYFTSYQTMLCTTTGDLTQARQLLATRPQNATQVRLEQARLALYEGDFVTAMVTAQSIGNPDTTTRQLIDRNLIYAVAAWESGHASEALDTFANASRLLLECGSLSILTCVPYAPLLSLSHAAREAQVADMIAFVERIPEPARSKRYEMLTEMELRTLESVAQHKKANQAAEALFVTPGTVKKHLAAVYRKLQVNGRDEAILQASRIGLLRNLDGSAGNTAE